MKYVYTIFILMFVVGCGKDESKGESDFVKCVHSCRDYYSTYYDYCSVNQRNYCYWDECYYLKD